MSFTYTRSQLKNDINQGLKGKIGMISNTGDFINRVVRETKNQVKIRSSKRKQTLSPDLINGINRYACPSDLQDMMIIDIPAQAKRYDDSFGLVPVEQFNTRPQAGDIAIDDYNGVRTLLINSNVSSQSTVLNNTNLASEWTVFGDGENISLDSDNFILGNGSIKFGISNAGGTTAGIVNSSIDVFDLTTYLGNTSSLFVWVYVTSVTNISNFTMRLGSDASNYYQKSVTVAFDDTAFKNGWNLLRFPISSLTTVGTPVGTAIDYLAMYMTKTAGKISEINYRFNYPVIKRGIIHDVLYYSKYGWQTSAGAYIQSSTDDQDLLVADDTEYDLFVKKGIELGLPFVNGDQNEVVAATTEFNNAALLYGMSNPDESQIMTTTYHQQ